MEASLFDVIAQYAGFAASLLGYCFALYAVEPEPALVGA